MSNRDAHDLAWFCEWFERQCDGGWEQAHGTSVGTIDNPGWRLRVDVRDESESAVLVARGPSEVDDGRGRWFRAWFDNDAQQFNAAGSPEMLAEMFATFRTAVQGGDATHRRADARDALLVALGEWYASQCDGDWEHGYRIHASVGFGSEWRFRVDLEDTPLEGMPPPTIADPSQSSATIDGTIYRAAGTGKGLPQAIDTFITWAGHTGLAD